MVVRSFYDTVKLSHSPATAIAYCQAALAHIFIRNRNIGCI
jgi:hypothetical protein